MVKHWGNDFAENARGIYFADDLRGIDKLHLLDDPCDFDWYHPKVLSERRIFIPSFKGIDWKSPEEAKRRARARTATSHALQNEEWNKSEFAWDADARSDVFGEIRHDPYLDMDKREYSAHLAETHPTLCTLTGKRTLVKRTPDVTFALSTYKKDDWFPSHNYVFREDRLQRLLLHPKIGLIADPKWGHTNMVFPWAVYEAKGWSGDYKEARRQACAGAARYLKTLDHLARVPGPPSTSMRYQTETSLDFQVFAFTSFGSHWHVLVGCKHDRLPEQHAGVKGMSKTVTLFRTIWSGSISTDRKAWELLYLVDQIHHWAKTRFRDFVIQHLKPWHKYCDENYLFDWDTDDENSKAPQSRKRRRGLEDDREDLRLPKWCDLVEAPLRSKMLVKERESLRELLREREALRSRVGGVEEWETRLRIVKRTFPSDGRDDEVSFVD